MKKPFKPEAAVRRDIQKLQRAVVDALEDVKAINIRVFDTEQLSPLFERVIVASGNTNRQTRALAASVRDRVHEAGFDKPGIEGEENGEWIIVDCGTVVAHILQPAIRDYYRLEEIWGETPVRLRLGAPAPVVRKMAVKKSVAGDTEKPASRARKTPAKKASATSKAALATKTVRPVGTQLPARTPPKNVVLQAKKLVKEGYVNELDGTIDPKTGYPRIVGAWAVNSKGALTGEFIPNPKYVWPKAKAAVAKKTRSVAPAKRAPAAKKMSVPKA